MIIDNADDSEVFFKSHKGDLGNSGAMNQPPLKTGLGSYIPECSHGSILVTTRNKQVGIKLTRNRDVIEVAAMSQAESIELIRKRIEGDSSDDSDLAVLTEQLGNLPLTLVQAAAFIQENTLSIKTYLDILQSSDEARVNLLSQAFEEMGRDSAVPNAVTTTWMISFNQIKEQQPYAAGLLSLMSFFNRQDIPKSLLSHDEKDLVELEKALGVLKAYSFITASVQDKSFNMHRLIHLVTRKWLEIEGEAGQWAERGLAAVAESFPSADYENWTECAALLPHSYAVLHSAKDETAVLVYLLYNTASYLWYRVQWKGAEKLYTQAFKIGTRVQGSEHPNTLATMNGLASTYRELGQLDKAEPLGEGVLEIMKRVLGLDHPDTLTSMNSLAITYYQLGQLDKAEPLGQEVLKIRKRLLGLEHPYTLTTMNNLASTYRQLGQLDKAEPLGEEVLKIRKRVLGPEHPDTLKSMGDLALTYVELGQLDKAEQLGEEVLKIMKRVLGPEHPGTLSSMNNLASTYGDLGQLDMAEQLGEEVLKIRKRVLGPDHPDTLIIMNNLASTYLELEQLDKAEQLGEEVLKMMKRVLGPEHRSTLTSMHHLAITWKKQSRDRDAIGLLLECVRLSTKVLGSAHPDTVSKKEWLEYCQNASFGQIRGRARIRRVFKPYRERSDPVGRVTRCTRGRGRSGRSPRKHA